MEALRRGGPVAAVVPGVPCRAWLPAHPAYAPVPLPCPWPLAQVRRSLAAGRAPGAQGLLLPLVRVVYVGWWTGSTFHPTHRITPGACRRC